LNPFPIGNPAAASPFPEQNLATQTRFRTQPQEGLSGLGGTITQPMVDNPNSVLVNALTGQTITSTVTLQVSTDDLPVPGGGTAPTA
jgi:hypothetical protein